MHEEKSQICDLHARGGSEREATGPIQSSPHIGVRFLRFRAEQTSALLPCARPRVQGRTAPGALPQGK